MSSALRILLAGGVKNLLRPPYCSRRIGSSEVPPEGILEEIDDYGAHPDPAQQLPSTGIPYWAELEPDAREMGTETHAKKPGRRYWTSAGILKPDVTKDRLQAVNSIISIVFGLKKLAWAHMDRTLTVRDWQQHEWFNLMKAKQHPDLYLEAVSSAVSKFPAADIYILEKGMLSTHNVSMFPVVLHLRIVEAMLYVLLNPGYSIGQEHRVFSMDRNAVGKHFDIMVGRSKTSGVDLVQQLVEEANTLEKPRVRFTQELMLDYKRKFHSRGHNRNEEMCDALLQAIAFYELTSRRST